MYKNLMIKDFIEELSSKASTPGGGGAAALCASLASSLTCMVFNLTVGKKKFEELDESIKNSIKNGLMNQDENKSNFLEDIDKDAEAFIKLMAAYRMKKETIEEVNERNDKLKQGTIGALESPLHLAEKAYLVYDDILIATLYGNINAISDAGVSAIMIQSAIDSSILNVRINLSSLEDDEYKETILKRCKFLSLEGEKKKDHILNIVNEKIR
ncbi:MAG: cyclodeaminase/cyclohydrolase family protein [Clostridiaceae bacterium]